LVYDIAIVGGGPAGLSAVVAAGARNKNVALIDKGGFGESLRKAHKINNYIGFPHITGAELMSRFYEHAMSFNPTLVTKKVQSIFPGDVHTLLVEDEVIQAKTVILCTGFTQETQVEGEAEFLGQGVSYCATCDGMFFKDKQIAVYINNYKEMNDLLFLQSIAEHLIVLGSNTILKEAKAFLNAKHVNTSNVVYENSKIIAVKGKTSVSEVVLENKTIAVEAVFFLRDIHLPTQLINGIRATDSGVWVDQNLMTNYPGIFAAGDVLGEVLQIAKATGDGLKAVMSAVNYIDGQFI